MNNGDEAPGRPLQPAPLDSSPGNSPDSSNVQDEAVAAFLRRHPGWLAAHPELYAALDPPRRVHGEALTDHMAALLGAARRRADAAAAQTEAATADRRAAEGFALRVQDAVIALMRAPDPAWCIQHDLPALLRLDSARLCIEGLHADAAAVPLGTVASVLGQRAALVRDDACAPLLHGEAAALAGREALVRVPLQRGPALLALACRDRAALAGATTAVLAFLGRAVAAALEPNLPGLDAP